MRVALACILMLAISSVLLAEQPANVSFYEVLRCQTAPVPDGKLDDGCWQSLPVMDQFYQYWTPIAKPPALKTAARLCYDDRGLYMGITMYEDKLDLVRANITSRDDPELWKDDCVEIMIDPGSSATNYYKFTTNVLGTRYDEKTKNLINDAGWNVEGWQVRASRGTDAWYIEFFVPWTDLEQQPREGEIWSFDVVRYAYSSGGFKGVTWALGGSYAQPGKFGYLGFGKLAPYGDKTLGRMAQVMRRTKGDHFRMLLPEGALTYQAGKWRRETLGEWAGAAVTALREEVREADEALATVPAGDDRERLDKAQAEVRARLAEAEAKAAGELTPGVAALLYEEALAARRQAAEVKWEARLLGLVAEQ